MSLARPQEEVARAQRPSDSGRPSCYKPVKAPSARAIRELVLYNNLKIDCPS